MVCPVASDPFAQQHLQRVTPVRFRSVLSLRPLDFLHVDMLHFLAELPVDGGYDADFRVGRNLKLAQEPAVTAGSEHLGEVIVHLAPMPHK